MPMERTIPRYGIMHYSDTGEHETRLRM